jgi:hypothetical protein
MKEARLSTWLFVLLCSNNTEYWMLGLFIQHNTCFELFFHHLAFICKRKSDDINIYVS